MHATKRFSDRDLTVILCLFAIVTVSCLVQAQNGSGLLFDETAPKVTVAQFSAKGFSVPVCGVIYDAAHPTCCGMPLGGISTGCIDLETSGVLGFNSVFNSYPREPVENVPSGYYPRKAQLLEPFLGISVDGKTTVLATRQTLDGGTIQTCKEPAYRGTWGVVNLPKVEGVDCAQEILYFGHYPIADLEYKTDCPIKVGLRAWSPFVPGDTAVSITPGAVFEVYLKNTTNTSKSGTLAFSFSGPATEEAETYYFTRKRQTGSFNGLVVMGKAAEYALGVVGEESVRIGAGLMRNGQQWAQIHQTLPTPVMTDDSHSKSSDASSAIAVDFSMAANESKIIRFVLSWYTPQWYGYKGTSPNKFTRAYTARYANAFEAADRLARDHPAILQKIIRFQQVIYSDKDMPVWLREALVNNLYLIPESTYWALPRPPLGDWCYPTGLFSMTESVRGCAQMSCIPCDWYGNLPIVYFYPELAAANLRGFAAYMNEKGAVPMAFGRSEEIAQPDTIPYIYQETLNGCCFADMVDRVWLRTSDNAILSEFYPAVRKNTIFTMNLNTKSHGVIRMTDGENKQEWFEHVRFPGLAAHIGGIRLAHLEIAKRMAEQMNDTEFVKRCDSWLKEGKEGMENILWKDGYYQTFNEPETGAHSGNVVMANQLDGQWMAVFHGLSPVFQPQRATMALETIKKVNIPMSPYGAVDFVRADGRPIRAKESIYTTPDDPEAAELKETAEQGDFDSSYGNYSMFPPELMILAMTYIYDGQKEFGLDLAKRCMENLILNQRCPWDMPNMIYANTGRKMFGTDYYQNMMLWAMPAAVKGQDIKQLSDKGQLIDRIIQPED